MTIRKENAPMANYQIARRLGIHPAQTFKRLRQMANNRVLHANDGYPKFYDLNASNEVQNFIVHTIECPKCQQLHIRHQSQTTIQCSCKTSSGKPRRFYIYNSRIKNKKVLTKKFDEDKTEEVKLLAKQDEQKKQKYLEEQKEIQQDSVEKENDVKDIFK